MNDLLAARICATDGLFTAADALDCGYDRKSLSRLAQGNEVARIGRGTYAAREVIVAASRDERHRLATRAVVRRFAGAVAASHYSALALLGLPMWGSDLGRVHVVRSGQGRARRSAGVQIHKCPADIRQVLVDGTLSVVPELAVLGTAALCGVEAGVIAADAALSAGIVTASTLDRCLHSLDRHPGVSDARLAVSLADRRSESVGESRTRLLLRSLDLGSPVPQVEIRDSNGYLVGRVDFLYEEQQTIVEFDGLVKYGDSSRQDTLVAEKRREDRLRDLGFQVVRIVWAELDRPLVIKRRLEAAFARAAGRTFT